MTDVAVDSSTNSRPNLLQKIWVEVTSIDLRTLALFRIGLAIALLMDLGTFWPHISLFLSDSGIFPRAFPIQDRPSEAFSLFFISGNTEMVAALFVATTIFALMLLFGYYTRIATVLCWIMIASLNGRAYVYLSYADVQLCIMFFWAMFLPLGARFSIDAALAKEQPSTTYITTAATFAILLQITYVYFVGALIKTGDAWHVTHTAVQAAVAAAHLMTPISHLLLENPAFSKWLTHYVFHLELYSPIFLFFPFINRYFRIVMFILLASMHIGFYLFLKISIFPFVSIVGLTVFIPSLFWEVLRTRRERSKHFAGHTLYYDQDCGFCHKVCRIFLTLSGLVNSQILPAQSDKEMGALLEKENSWIIKTAEGKLLMHWDAVAWIWRRSPILWPLGFLFLPKFMHGIGASLYALIAKNRASLAKISARMLPLHDAVSIRPHLLTSIIVCIFTFAVFFNNVRSLEGWKMIPEPKTIAALRNYGRLWQYWSMFAPYPSTNSTWGVIEGKLADGRTVDLFFDRDEPPRTTRPALGRDAYPLRRWHKFFTSFKWKGGGYAVGKAFCNRWREAGHRTPLTHVNVYMYVQQNKLDLPIDQWPIEKKTLLEYTCVAPPAPNHEQKGENGKEETTASEYPDKTDIESDKKE